MGIGNYIKEIGRGKDGARALNREQAADLFGQVLDGAVTDLEIGAFCIAMRVKGETPEEMAMEACGGAHHWARELSALGHTVRLLHAKIVRPFVSGKKTDATDARAIWLAVQHSRVSSLWA
jgi:anthranilate phosphoribosyltransferase